MKSRILVIDDEPSILSTLSEILADEGYDVATADRAGAGLKQFEAEPVDLVLLDVRLPDGNGIEVLRQIKQARPATEVVMISGHGTIEIAVEAIKDGAYDFLEKPLTLKRVLLTVTHALEKSRLRQQQQELLTAAEHRYQMIGESAAMKRVWADIEKVAPTNARVLITGESGTGKELVAFWLHKLSPRKDERLVKINCAAIPRELIESEMFGYEKGAFTGAAQRRQGKFEVADKGTFFLDEIGEMDAFAQTKLLRVLEDGEFTRVGGVTPTKVDVRVISATNKDIKAAVEKGEFRSDLFHRLDVFEIRLPPLRARAEDIPVLARYFLDEYCRDNGLAPKKLTESGTSFLSSLKLPGNIRELRNLIERAAIISSGPEIGVEDFQPSLTPDIQFPTSDADDFRRARDLHVAKEELESKYIETQLKLNGWSITRTAQRLGIERSNLSRRMKQLGIEKPDFYLHPPITTD